MDSKVNYALTGAFVMVLSFLLAVGILWLSAGGEDKAYKTYQAFMRESVSGLNEGAQVKYRGVEVGRVKKITLSPDNPEQVKLLLEIEHGTPVKQDTVAILKTQGLTGLAYIELTGGTKESPPPEVEVGDRYPEIKTGPSLLVRLDTAISGLLKQMDGLSSAADQFLVDLNNLALSANILLSPENRMAISHTLHHVEQITATLAGQSDLMARGTEHAVVTLRNAARISEQIPPLLELFTETALNMQQTSNKVYATSQTANQLMLENREALKRSATALADSAETLSNMARHGNRGVSQLSTQTLPEINLLVNELRVTLNNLRRFTQELERKPNSLLFGGPEAEAGPGE